jgi:hypothetical protein
MTDLAPNAPDADVELLRAMGYGLSQERPAFDKFDSYMANAPVTPMGYIAPEVAAEVGNRLSPVIANYPGLVVSAIENRLDVQGFRMGPQAGADSGLWDLWCDNGMELAAQQAHVAALTYGRCPVIVWSAGELGSVRISVESPRQVAVQYDAGATRAVAAVKIWQDTAWAPGGAVQGYAHAVVLLPDRVTRYRSAAKVAEAGYPVPPGGDWVIVDSMRNPLGVVPVVELVNRPALRGASPPQYQTTPWVMFSGQSELVDVIPLTDAISKLLTDMMVSAEFSAMPRRWLTGLQLPEKFDPTTGEATPDASAALDATSGRVWFAEDGAAKFGQFPEANLEGYGRAVDLLVQQLASTTGIPAHYLNSLTGQLPSAESLRAAEASLIAKVQRRQSQFGTAWADVARLAFLVRDGRLPADSDDLEVVWANAATISEGEEADAVTKLVAAGVLPPSAALERLGYPPSQIDRISQQRKSDTLNTTGLDLSALLSSGDGSS